jgi:hypothetical protein
MTRPLWLSPAQAMRLVLKAQQLHGESITPCGGKAWGECFTLEQGRVIFWYNLGPDTHAVIEPHDVGALVEG